VSGFRSQAARDLVRVVEAAGGEVKRTGTGRMKITGPAGSVTIQEPGEETRRDLRRSSAGKLIEARCGLDLASNS